MKVILTQPVAGLGETGTVKEVANGYARNYLIPRGLATLATEGALKQVREQATAQERRQAKVDAEMATLGRKIEGTEVVIAARAGEQERLFGSVTAADIAEALSAKLGLEIDRRKIQLEDTIHQLGTYELSIHLTRTVQPRFTVKVVPQE